MTKSCQQVNDSSGGKDGVANLPLIKGLSTLVTAMAGSNNLSELPCLRCKTFLDFCKQLENHTDKKMTPNNNHLVERLHRVTKNGYTKHRQTVKK